MMPMRVTLSTVILMATLDGFLSIAVETLQIRKLNVSLWDKRNIVHYIDRNINLILRSTLCLRTFCLRY